MSEWMNGEWVGEWVDGWMDGRMVAGCTDG